MAEETEMNYVQIAKDIRAAAKVCINEARKQDNDYYTHREIELVACDGTGERISDEATYLSLSEVSGATVKAAIRCVIEDCDTMRYTYSHIGVFGGVDAYESLSDCLKGYEYTPMANTWDLADIPLTEELL
jgi:hypothetical protein